jgi:hypothetical protein
MTPGTFAPGLNVMKVAHSFWVAGEGFSPRIVEQLPALRCVFDKTSGIEGLFNETCEKNAALKN